MLGHCSVRRLPGWRDLMRHRAGGNVSGATNSSTSAVAFGRTRVDRCKNENPGYCRGRKREGMQPHFGASFFISSFFSFLWALWCFALASSFLSIGLSILSIGLQAVLSPWAKAKDDIETERAMANSNASRLFIFGCSFGCSMCTRTPGNCDVIVRGQRNCRPRTRLFQVQ